jgi:hypothetical protein
MLEFGPMVDLAWFNDSDFLFGWRGGKFKFPLSGIARLKWVLIQEFYPGEYIAG